VFAASLVLSGFAAAPAQAQTILNSEVTIPPPSPLAPGGANLIVGVNGGTGILNINTNGSLLLNALGIGGTEGTATIDNPLPSGTGTVNVTGPNASLVVTNQLFVGPTAPSGSPGSGTLNITGGATVTQQNPSFVQIGGGAATALPPRVPGTGTVLVSGVGSTFTTSPDNAIEVGQFGTGTLTIQNGGVVNTGAVVLFGPNSPGGGTLNIGAAPGQPPVAPGTLNTTIVQSQGSTLTTPSTGTPGTINFNHTSNDGSYVFLPAIVAEATSANNGVVNVIAGTTVFKPDTGILASGFRPYGGQTTIFSGATWAAGEVNAFSPNSNTVVNSGGRLDLQGFSQSLLNSGDSRNPFPTTTVTNAGTVLLGVPGVTPPGTTLTVNNYVGNGGVMAMNTFLGTDGSASDKLVISGGIANGTSLLRITNVGGPGDQTTANGILVVQAINSGTTVPGAFTLGGAELRGGAFDYDLFRGGLNGSDPNNWFLRSTFIGPEGPGPAEPIGPTPPPSTPGLFPIIGPELATYGVVQPIARQMGLTTLGTYHERVGDAAADAACLSADTTGSSGTLDSAITKAPPVPYENCRQALWGRVFGQQINDHYEAFADPRASGQVAGIQTGIDLWSGSLIPGHSDVVGVYFAYGNGNVSVDGLVTNPAATAYILEHTGSVNLNAFSGGGYWTHRGPTGWYIDAVLQGSLYNGNAATQFASLPINGAGFTSSLEAGYPIPLPWFGPRFVLEPEAQIIWQRVSFDQDNDGLGPVGLGTTSGVSGRLGLRGKWTINDAAGRVWQPYVLANVWRDWGADATTMFGPDPVPLLEKATRLEFAGGLSAKILPGLSLYAQAGYQFAVSGTDGGRRDGVKGDFGVHYTW
jgi:outer membrane autotransporter protein